MVCARVINELRKDEMNIAELLLQRIGEEVTHPLVRLGVVAFLERDLDVCTLNRAFNVTKLEVHALPIGFIELHVNDVPLLLRDLAKELGCYLQALAVAEVEEEEHASTAIETRLLGRRGDLDDVGVVFANAFVVCHGKRVIEAQVAFSMCDVKKVRLTCRHSLTPMADHDFLVVDAHNAVVVVNPADDAFLNEFVNRPDVQQVIARIRNAHNLARLIETELTLEAVCND